jgi:anti-sigma factor RsiW
MTPNFNLRNDSQPSSSEDAVADQPPSASQPCPMLDSVKRDRFELLSAYLDGEVTVAERRQVEQWLATDPSVQNLYARLLKLRQVMRVSPVPVPEQSAEQVSQKVFEKLNRRQRLIKAWGGVAIAAVFVGVLSSLAPPVPLATHQLALEQPTTSPDVSSDALMIALDQPIIEIPKTPVEPSVESPQPPAN